MTYSIVARDPRTGQLGVAVQSHFFNVGSVVLAASAGMGAIATQSFPDVQHKPRALAMLREGRSADEIVSALLDGDPGAASRQFAVVDTAGRAAAHTGTSCVAAAGHAIGDGYSCQANMMRAAAVWPAMAEAFEATIGHGLTGALLAALDAAELAGGDLRGRQSAAILVVPPEGTDADRIVDLRVEDAPEPLQELRRLVVLNDAYELTNEADALLSLGDVVAAADRYVAAYESAPDNVELKFWGGLGLLAADLPERGLLLLRETIAEDASWHELLRRLPPDLVPVASEALRLLDT